MIVADGTAIGPGDLGLEAGAEASQRLSLREVRRRAESAAVREAMEAAGGNLTRAAELLGVTRPTLYDLIERLGLQAPGAAQGAEAQVAALRSRS